MNKKERHNLILKVILENEIATQEELTDSLSSLGLEVSQATLSRDINDLGLIKVSGKEKKSIYVKPFTVVNHISENIIELFRRVTVSMVVANNLLIVKTIEGNGSSVGMAVDQMKIPEILGTIAGDDTLLIVAKNNGDAEKILKSLKAVKC